MEIQAGPSEKIACAWEIDLDDWNKSSSPKRKPDLSKKYIKKPKKRVEITPCTMSHELMLNRKVLDVRRW